MQTNSTLLETKNFYNRKETSLILQIPDCNVPKLIKNGKLKLYDDTKHPKRITVESILSYKKELDERRKLSPVKWLNTHHVD